MRSSSRLRRALVDWAWSQWAQMGVLAAPSTTSPWAQDPEALIVFTLSVGRHDARLFDEVLDWTARNQAMVSKLRLRAMCVDDEDARLVSAALAVAEGGDGRAAGSPAVARATAGATPLFGDLPLPARLDASFAEHGFARPPVTLSGKSRAPALDAPINLAFRLRHLLGLSARAEAARCLLTMDAEGTTTTTIARSAGYARRNVVEALTALRASGAARSVVVRAEQRVAVDRAAWCAVLGVPVSWLPEHRDWPQLLAALRRIERWMRDPARESESAYLRSSAAFDVLDLVADDLRFAGVHVEQPRHHRDAEAALQSAIDAALAALLPEREPPSAHADRTPSDRSGWFEIAAAAEGGFVWTLRAANGHALARAPTPLPTERAAREAVRSVAAQAPELRIDAHAHAPGPRYSWLAVPAHEHAPVASSPGTFSTSHNAKRAGERFRRAAVRAARRSE